MKLKYCYVLFLSLLGSVFGAEVLAVDQGSFGLGWSYGVFSFHGNNTRNIVIAGKIPLATSLNLSVALSFGKLKLDSANVSNAYNLNGLEFGIANYFALRRPVNPFISMNLSGYWPNDGDRGYGLFGSFGAGAGLRFRLSEQIVLNLSGSYNYWINSTAPLKNEMTGLFARLHAGLEFHFPIRRATIADVIESPQNDFNRLTEKQQYDFVLQLTSYEQKEEQLEVIKNMEEDLTPEIEQYIKALQMALINKETSLAELQMLTATSEERIAELEKKLLGKKIEKVLPLPEPETAERVAEKPSILAHAEVTAPAANQVDLEKVAGPTLDTMAYIKQYNEAHDNFNKKQYEAALAKFRNLLDQDPGHKLAGNCQYWIGESFYGMKNYQATIEAMLQTLEFKESSKLDDALLMLGQSYYRLGDLSQARKYFEQLLQKYPDSEYRQVALTYIYRVKS